MPYLTEEEFAELLQHLQMRMREHNLGELNQRILADIRIDPGRPSTQLIRYIDALIAELRLGNDTTIRTMIDSANQFVRTELGRGVDGLSVVFSDADRELFGRDTVDLGVGRDLASFLDDLERLRGQLLESREDQ